MTRHDDEPPTLQADVRARPSEAALRPRRSPDASATGRAPLFREQAVQAHGRATTMGSPLRIVPTWMVASTRLVVLVVVSAIAFASVARVSDYVRGPAVIRVDGRELISARVAGSVTAIAVHPGQRVESGAVLVQFDATAQGADLARVEREYELLLARLLRDPRADGLRTELAGLDAERQLARARLDERTVRAPEAGLVSDVRVRVGHYVTPGDALVALDRERSRIIVVGMLPGHERPRLSQVGTQMQLELDGFPRERVTVTVRAIADEVVGPSEALRYLGKDQADAFAVQGPVVVVEATVDDPELRIDGNVYRLYDGMQGFLEMEVDSQTVLQSLLPAFDRQDGS